MQRLCSEHRKAMLHPFALKACDDDWVVTCDGTMFVATRQSTDEPPGDKTITKTLIGFIEAAPRPDAFDDTVESLAAFAGKPQWELSCSTCDGKGVVPAPTKCEEPGCDEGIIECICFDCNDVHERDCKRCDGTGEGPLSTRKGDTVECEDCKKGLTIELESSKAEPVVVAGQIVDRRRLARLLTPVAVAGDCTVWAERDALHARGMDFHLTLMKLRSDPPDDVDTWP